MTGYVATNIVEFTDAIVAITKGFGDTRPWWRGQVDVSWPLVPGLFRRELADSESALNARFRLMAGARYDKCPEMGDAFGWLSLMQHYRLPTRLLDWSASPLIALFFAVEEDPNDKEDAAVWAVFPIKLNLAQLGREGILQPSSRDLRRLSSEAFVRNTRNPDPRIIAVLPEQSDLRQMMQQSAFTIHGCNTPINELPEADGFLVPIRIPATAKPGLRELLSMYGIARASLFPDLENLAKELVTLTFHNPAKNRHTDE